MTSDAYQSPALPLGGAAAWTAATLAADKSWIVELNDAERSEIRAAFYAVRDRAPYDFSQEDFPAPKLAAKLADLRDEMENGRGLALLKNVPIEGLNDDEARVMYWGIGSQFAPAVAQNRNGDRLWSVRDEAAGANQVHVLSGDGDGGLQPISSRAKARSNGPLRFHTDGTDTLALLCVRPAASGGGSKLASSVTVHDEILRRRPDLHALLCQDYHRMFESNETSAGGGFYALPIFTRVGDYFSSQYSRTYVEEAQKAGAPEMSPAQDEALDLLAEIAEETCLRFTLEKGDMFFANCHTTYHGREPFNDEGTHQGTAAQDRLLLRLWFAPENSRPLAEPYANIWNTIKPGAIRSSYQQYA